MRERNEAAVVKTDRNVADSWRTLLLWASGIEGQGYMSQERGSFVWKVVENSRRRLGEGCECFLPFRRKRGWPPTRVDSVLTCDLRIYNQNRLERNYLTFYILTEYCSYVTLKRMSMTEKTETVWFTTKGQVVIPLRLRKEFDIEDGTKAVVQATPEGILLKPVTAALIKRGRGILKRAQGDKTVIDQWSEHKKQERALEDRHAG